MPEALPVFPGFDKIMHFVEYFILGYLISRALYVVHPSSFAFRNVPCTAVAIGVLYGISDEWHQSFVPGRDASIFDLLFDALGVFMAVFFFNRLRYGVRSLMILENRLEETLRYEK